MSRSQGLVLVWILFLTACSTGPGRNQVKKDFQAMHPDYTVVEIYTGEGDGAAVYYHIKYKKPGEDRIHEDEWQYVNTVENMWALRHRETLK